MYHSVEEAQALEVVELARREVLRGKGAGSSSSSSSPSSSLGEGGEGEFSVAGVPPVMPPLMVLTVPSSCIGQGDCRVGGFVPIYWGGGRRLLEVKLRGGVV